MGSVKNLAVLISGAGTVCSAIIDSCNKPKGVLKDVAQVKVIISSHADNAFLYQNLVKLKSEKPAFFYLPYENSDQWHQQMYEIMDWYDVDLICLAGFIKKISVWAEWEGKILNTHPSLLPKFGGKGMYGDNVHKAVLEAKEKETGCTVHVVDNQYDNGEILKQVTMPLSENLHRLYKNHPRALGRDVRRLEYVMYPQTIADYLKEQ